MQENYFLIARDKSRTNFKDVIRHIFTDFYELTGDRSGFEDKAIIGGLAKFNGQKVMIVGHNKGHNIDEDLECNFGMPSPEGFRKAIRLFDLANCFKLPVITFIDTPGAYPGKDAEERGQSEAIATSMMKMLEIEVPILSIVLSEGSSGGALGLSLGNRLCMLEKATYSILSPEGFASILFKDESKVDEVSNLIKARAKDLYDLNIVDEIIKEDDPLKNIALTIANFLEENKKYKASQIVAKRFKKYRMIDKYEGN